MPASRTRTSARPAGTAGGACSTTRASAPSQNTARMGCDHPSIGPSNQWLNDASDEGQPLPSRFQTRVDTMRAVSEFLVIAVILAAGRGTRMGSLTAHVTKPLLPLRGQPIIEHILTGLRAAGVGKAIIITGYRAEQIEGCLGGGEHLGVELTYCRQAQADGTARALLLAREAVGDGPFLLSWSDIVVESEQYRLMLDEFERAPCDALLTVNAIDDPWQGAAVYVDENWRVLRLIEKPPRGSSQTPWNNAGIFVFTHVIFDYAERLAPSARGE